MKAIYICNHIVREGNVTYYIMCICVCLPILNDKGEREIIKTKIAFDFFIHLIY